MAEMLGVDIGGVIISRTADNGRYLPVPDAFTALRRLVRERFGEGICLVSRASAEQEGLLLSWLRQQSFPEITGIPIHRVYFCRKLSDKAVACKVLSITHFIDDRSEVLEHLHRQGVPNLYLFRGSSDEIEPRKHLLAHVTQVPSWREVMRSLVS